MIGEEGTSFGKEVGVEEFLGDPTGEIDPGEPEVGEVAVEEVEEEREEQVKVLVSPSSPLVVELRLELTEI